MSVDVELIAGAALGVGSQAHPTPVHGNKARYSKTARPVTVPASYTSQNPAQTYGFMFFPQVTPNKIWEVKRIAASQLDPWAAALANAPMIFRSALMPQDGAQLPALNDFLGKLAVGLPDAFSPPLHSIVLRGNERVGIILKGLGNAVSIVGSMDVVEYDLDEYLSLIMSQ